VQYAPVSPFAFGISAFGVGSFGPSIIYLPEPVFFINALFRNFTVYDLRNAWGGIGGTVGPSINPFAFGISGFGVGSFGYPIPPPPIPTYAWTLESGASWTTEAGATWTTQ
jgi:hypothetical protein